MHERWRRKRQTDKEQVGGEECEKDEGIFWRIKKEIGPPGEIREIERI